MVKVKYDCGHEIEVEIQGDPGKEHISYPDYCPVCESSEGDSKDGL